MKFLIIIALIALILFFVNKFLSRYKFPKTTAISVFTGAVKSGKSAVSLAHAIGMHKKAKRSYRVRLFFVRFINRFRKKPLPEPEEPLLYSNIPLKYPYVKLTTDLLLRRKRFAYKSIVFIDEASLVCDSQLIKDKFINNELLLFFKLFGHETRGGKCIVNTQSISDLHYALKRCTSQYFYIHHLSKYIPFISACKMREERYCEDGSTINTYSEDLENSLRTVLFKKSVFKKYDCFCFSELTDKLDLEKELNYIKRNESLKINNIVSFREEFKNLGD